MTRHATDLFDAETIERWQRHFACLLEEIAADPTRRVSELVLLTQEEQTQQLVEWNATAREYPRDTCIHELFEAQVEARPDAVAVVCDGASLSYGELNARANRLAHHLRSLGVGPEVRVGVCLERSVVARRRRRTRSRARASMS